MSKKSSEVRGSWPPKLNIVDRSQEMSSGISHCWSTYMDHLICTVSWTHWNLYQLSISSLLWSEQVEIMAWFLLWQTELLALEFHSNQTLPFPNKPWIISWHVMISKWLRILLCCDQMVVAILNRWQDRINVTCTMYRHWCMRCSQCCVQVVSC